MEALPHGGIIDFLSPSSYCPFIFHRSLSHSLPQQPCSLKALFLLQTGPVRLLGTQLLGFPLLQGYPKLLCAGDRRTSSVQEEVTRGSQVSQQSCLQSKHVAGSIEHLCLARHVM